ncbi:putative 26S proteasome complex subunit sem1-1-like isoform X1 [Hibiscus syriacus]|uniref:RING-type E3 ubiquitin transferase n=1 Tax=Hibiscus syriacus TaxID=106335 RepID=A0A6A3CCP8_HIBSY|nr:putative 26S proteasome complex subunit sem1-1-like isoform X1 [Hibiscus syriacus]
MSKLASHFSSFGEASNQWPTTKLHVSLDTCPTFSGHPSPFLNHSNISSYQSKSLATQRRNARETIRLVGILVVFFEDINDRGSVVSESAVLCFSELHLTLQKIRFLLEDCSREGARLWILMKSEMAATQFRVLIRSVATVLDVLPLDSFDACGEVKELVELVAKQARKAKIEIDPDNERAARCVLSVLDQFEKGIEPEFQILKWVLDYLEIRTWSDCNKEVKFLEEQCVEGEEREVLYLSSLLGFMCYCRGRMFDTLDGQNADQTDVRPILSCLNPEDFRCPISLELMIDPVTVSTGHTYDRNSIQKWLKAGHTVCPKTGEKLTNTELVPNANLRKLIHQFCSDNGISLAKTVKKSRDITRTIVPASPAAAEAMKFLPKLLVRNLISGSSEQKNKAAYEIRLLAKSNVYNRSCLIEAGTIPPLLNLLYSFNKSIQENGIAALLKLSKHASGKKIMVESGGLRKLIGEMDETISALVDLIKEGTPCGRKNAVVALFGLALYPGNRQRVIDAEPSHCSSISSLRHTNTSSSQIRWHFWRHWPRVRMEPRRFSGHRRCL